MPGDPVRLCARVSRALALLTCCALPAFAPAQDKPADRDKDKDKKDAVRVDPYTKNEPAALERAGYVGYGPFTWSHDHDTRDLEKTLGGGTAMKFTETEHLKLATSLPPFPLPLDKEVRTRLQDELKRLQKRIPKVDPNTKVIDSWLRHHLFAQRCEDAYADFVKRLALDDKALPLLGQKNKYTVLLLELSSNLERYFQKHLKVDAKNPMRWNFIEHGAMFFGTSLEQNDGALRSDRGIHCLLVYNLVHNFVAGYRGYFYEAPLWWEEGLAHWFERQIDPKFNHFGALKENEATLTKEWEWRPKIRARVGFDVYPTFARMLAWKDPTELAFADHMMVWSRIDFLASLGEEKLGAFLVAIKGKQDQYGTPPNADALRKLQIDALKLIYGFDPEAFDVAWKKWVLAKYPAK